MIHHTEFHKLRLADFIVDAEIARLDDWELMDRIWVGEALGFSEWLRLKSEPDSLRSLAIDFKNFPEDAAERVLRAIDLPVRRGMSVEEVVQFLGPATQALCFVKDRTSYDFVLSQPSRYDISCTILDDGGLTYLVVMDPSYANTDAA